MPGVEQDQQIETICPFACTGQVHLTWDGSRRILLQETLTKSRRPVSSAAAKGSHHTAFNKAELGASPRRHPLRTSPVPLVSLAQPPACSCGQAARRAVRAAGHPTDPADTQHRHGLRLWREELPHTACDAPAELEGIEHQGCACRLHTHQPLPIRRRHLPPAAVRALNCVLLLPPPLGSWPRLCNPLGT